LVDVLQVEKTSMREVFKWRVWGLVCAGSISYSVGPDDFFSVINCNICYQWWKRRVSNSVQLPHKESQCSLYGCQKM
jgi:hypothetical protein